MLALLRSSGWEWALLAHVVGAFLLFGGMTLVAIVAVDAARTHAVERSIALRRIGLRTLLFLVIPSSVLMRVSAEWVLSESPFPDDQAWVGLGYAIGDLGLLVVAGLTLAAWRSLRTAERTNAAPSLSGRIFAVVAALYVVALVVALWAMTAKPT